MRGVTMMVGRSPYATIGDLQFMVKLEAATKKLDNINQKHQVISQQELHDLIEVFKPISDPNFLADKKFASEGMSNKIEKALIAIALFQRNHASDRAAQRDVEQAITSLFSSLNSTLSKADKNLKNLKKHRIGQKVKESSESKESGSDGKQSGSE